MISVCITTPAPDVSLPELLDPAIALPPLREAHAMFLACYLRTALIRNKGNITRAARELGIYRNSLLRMRDRVGIPAGYAVPPKARRTEPSDVTARRLVGLGALPPKKPVRSVGIGDLPAAVIRNRRRNELEARLVELRRRRA